MNIVRAWRGSYLNRTVRNMKNAIERGYNREASRTKLPLGEEVKAALIAHHRDDLGAAPGSAIA